MTPGSNITLTEIGTHAFPIDKYLFEYRIKTNGEFTGGWTTLNTAQADQDSVQFTNPLEEYQVRMTIIYDQLNGATCGSKTIIQTIDPCNNFIEPSIENVFDLPNKLGGIRVNLNNSILNESVISIVSTVRINLGVAQSYTINPSTLYGDFIYTLDESVPNFILETLSITFASGCTYVLQDPIPITDIPLINSFAADPIVSGTFNKIKSGFGSNTRYLPDLSDIVLSEEPEEIRILVKNDDNSIVTGKQ